MMRFEISCKRVHIYEELTRNACERTRTEREFYCLLVLSGKM